MHRWVAPNPPSTELANGNSSQTVPSPACGKMEQGTFAQPERLRLSVLAMPGAFRVNRPGRAAQKTAKHALLHPLGVFVQSQPKLGICARTKGNNQARQKKQSWSDGAFMIAVRAGCQKWAKNDVLSSYKRFSWESRRTKTTHRAFRPCDIYLSALTQNEGNPTHLGLKLTCAFSKRRWLA